MDKRYIKVTISKFIKISIVLQNMNIAIFTDAFYPQIGGITTAIINHSENLVKKGNKIIIFAPKDKELLKELQIPDIQIIRIPSVSYPYYKEQKISFPNIIKIVNILKEFEVDIIHIQTPGSIGIAGCLSAKIIKKPLIGTYHTLVSEFAKYFSFIKPQIKNKSLFLDKSYKFIQQLIDIPEHPKYKIRKSLIWNITISIYNLCDLVLGPSLSVIKELKKHNIKPKVKYISNGLNLDNFKSKENYKSKQIKILHVGRLSYEKNIDIILKSMPEIIKHHPKIILNIIGGGPAKKTLEKLVKKLNIEKNVNFLGYIKRENLPDIYNVHDIFITASTMETQGIVILEAMASGLPIIGVKKYAIPDVVLHNKNGFLAKPGNLKKITEYLLKLIKDEKMREKFGRESLLQSKSHDLQKTIIELEKTYKNLLEQYSFKQLLKSSASPSFLG